MSEDAAADLARHRHSRLRGCQEEATRLRGELADARAALSAADVVAAGLRAEHRDIVAGLRSSRAYQWLLRLANIRDRLAPPGSAREAALRTAKALVRGRLREAVAAWRPPAPPAAPPLPTPEPPPPSIDDYARWIAAHEPGPADLLQQAATARTLAYRPLFSVLTPVYNTPPHLLREAVESVRAQTYPDWELLLLDGNSTDESTRATLTELAASDSRVRVVRRATNGGISANTNAALDLARGEFIALLDHDDLLAPDALYEMAVRLNADPDLDLLYSDKDLVSEDGGTRHSPFFKPAWSPALMLGANFLTHLTILRTDVARDVGGFRPETDGAQDWDLFLRVAERTDRIAHVPRVLYHWRVWGNSCASGIEAKAYAVQAQVRTIGEHLARTGRTGRVHVRPTDLCIHIQRTDTRAVSVGVVLTAGGPPGDLARLGDELLRGRFSAQISLAVAHAGGADTETAALLARWAARGVPVVAGPADGSVWALRNAAARVCRGDVLLFLDGGLVPTGREWLDEYLQWAMQPGIGVVGGRVSGPDGAVRHQGLLLGLGGAVATPFAGRIRDWSHEYGLPNWYRNYLAVAGSCLMIGRGLFDELGGFDEGYLADRADVELCLQARAAGWEVFYNPYASFEDAADRSEFAREDDEERFAARWGALLDGGDPFLNPHFDPATTRMLLRTNPVREMTPARAA